MTLLEEMLKKMSNLFQNLLEFFVLDPKKNTSEEFFGNIYKFMQEFEVSIFLKKLFSPSANLKFLAVAVFRFFMVLCQFLNSKTFTVLKFIFTQNVFSFA